MIRKLLVIIPDRLSILIQKGEILPCYYNPGNIFDEVHILMTNDDKPDLKPVQTMVGKARLFIHNHPEPPGFFKKTLGWQPFLVKSWLNTILETIKTISPAIIRCYGMHLNLAIGAYAKKRLGIPLLVSLHAHPVLDVHRENLSFKDRIVKNFAMKLSNNLKSADLIMPVYRGIVEFLEGRHIRNYQILYNKVGITKDEVKKEFNLGSVFKLICVGQQIPNKNPEQLIRAVARLENVSLDIIGTGVLNEYLKRVVNELKVNDKIKFIPSVPYLELCENLKNYDCFSASIDCIGISKTVIESFLAKLPVLLNLNSHAQVPELNDLICLRIPDTVEGYVSGIKKIMGNKDFRIDIAENAYHFARENWDPEKIEAQHVEIYKRYIF